MESSTTSRGQIVTFYSYKGGTGRSMAVANVACLLSKRLARTSKRVLVMDWDLEAPGLHRYFSARCDLPQYREQEGVMNYFVSLRALLDRSEGLYSALKSPEGGGILEQKLPLERYLTPDVVPGVDFMRAGHFDAEYAKLVSSFGWIDFYDRYAGAICAFRELLAEKFAYVLVDSRTGITDVSSICTALFPEKLVGVFVPNKQNIDGLRDVITQAIAYRGDSDDFRPLSVFPLPSRIDNAEQDLKKLWRKQYQNEFETLFKREYQVDNVNLTSYFDEVLLPHVSYYAYGENIAVLQELPDAISLSKAYQRFFDRLFSLDFPWQLPELVASVVEPTDEAQVRTTAIRYDAYLGYSLDDARTVSKIESQLAKLGVNCFLASRDLTAGDDFSAVTVAAMHESKTIVVFLGPSGVGPWQDQNQQSVLESFAKDGSKRIVPILLPKAPSIESLRLPPFLGRVQWIDMRSGVNSKEVEGLVWALTGTRPRSTSLFSFRRVLVLVAAIIILLGTPLYFGWPRIASRFGQPMQTQTRPSVPTIASAPPPSTGSAGAAATTSPAKPDSWGVRISNDATFGAPKPGGGSTIWEVGLAAARGYKDVSVYQVNDRYMTVINSADAQSAAGIRRDVTTKYITQTPYWAKAKIFNLAKLCPDANKIGEFAIPLTPGASKGKGISARVYGCGALPTAAKPFSVEYSGTIFRGAADKGVHVFAPSTRFAWMELFKGVWINQYILLGPASVAGCNGYSFVKTPVQIEGIQIFISSQDSGCDKPVLSYQQLKNGKWSDWTPIGEQLTYAGELPALPK